MSRGKKHVLFPRPLPLMQGVKGLMMAIFFRAMMPVSNDAQLLRAMMPVSNDAQEVPRPHPTPSFSRPFRTVGLVFILTHFSTA